MKTLNNKSFWDTYSFSLKTEELHTIKDILEKEVFSKSVEGKVSIFEISKSTTTLASGEVRHYFTVFYNINSIF